MSPSFGTLAAAQCLAEGIDSLSAEQQRALARLFRDEARKGAFRVPESGGREAFCRHIVEAFPQQHTTIVVYDYLKFLNLRARRAARSKSLPLVSLILYATWIEHWINMVITVAMLREGETPAAVEAYFDAQPRFYQKLVRLGPELSLPSLPAGRQAEVQKLITCRNDHVHYTWQGERLGEAHRRHGNLRNIVKHAPDLLSALRKWEYKALDAPFRQIVRSLFPLAG